MASDNIHKITVSNSQILIHCSSTSVTFREIINITHDKKHMILNHNVPEHKQNQLQAITGVDLKKLKQLQ